MKPVRPKKRLYGNNQLSNFVIKIENFLKIIACLITFFSNILSHYIADLIENEQKFLVFAHHQNMIESICQLLTSKKIM